MFGDYLEDVSFHSDRESKHGLAGLGPEFCAITYFHNDVEGRIKVYLSDFTVKLEKIADTVGDRI